MLESKELIVSNRVCPYDDRVEAEFNIVKVKILLTLTYMFRPISTRTTSFAAVWC